jgi:hypothetical protein
MPSIVVAAIGLVDFVVNDVDADKVIQKILVCKHTNILKDLRICGFQLFR